MFSRDFASGLIGSLGLRIFDPSLMSSQVKYYSSPLPLAFQKCWSSCQFTQCCFSFSSLFLSHGKFLLLSSMWDLLKSSAHIMTSSSVWHRGFCCSSSSPSWTGSKAVALLTCRLSLVIGLNWSCTSWANFTQNFTLAFLKVKNKIICNLYSVDLLYGSFEFINIQPKDFGTFFFLPLLEGKG